MKIFLLIIIIILFFFIINKYLINFEKFENNKSNNSFHILMATIGKESIFGMLECLNKQLNSNDYLTIVFDGPNLPNVDKIKNFCNNFKCKVNIIIEEKNLGFWGHGIRNKHNNLPGDFVFHIDDDDLLYDNCMDILREKCIDKDTIYIFKINNGGSIIWNKPEIIEGQISTQNGIIPTKLNSTAEFTYRYGGDFDFYKKLTTINKNVKYMDDIIYNKFNK